MPLPDPAPTISDSAVTGLPIAEALFPRIQARRIAMPQGAGEVPYFEKRAAEQLDYSVDLTALLESGELVLGCYAWTDVPDELVVTSVRFALKGVLAFVWGGLDATEYKLFVLAKTNFGRSIEFQAKIAVSQSASEALTDYRPPTMGTGSDPAESYLIDLRGEYLAPTYIDAAGVPLFTVPA